MGCQMCMKQLPTKKLPIIQQSPAEWGSLQPVTEYLRVYDACDGCSARYLTDAALFWHRQGRPMTTEERENYEAGDQLPGLGKERV